jgi:hypothetical protein
MNNSLKCLNANTLRLLACALMLCDHMWATVVPGNVWMTWLGRLAFPIFAFQIAEGLFHTSNFKKYAIRLLIFGIVSEIPFDLVYGSTILYPFHQNVMFTLLLGLLAIKALDNAKSKFRAVTAIGAGSTPSAIDNSSSTPSAIDNSGSTPSAIDNSSSTSSAVDTPTTSRRIANLALGILIAALCTLAAAITFTDYGAMGVLTIIAFYVFRDFKFAWLGQLVFMILANMIFFQGEYLPLTIAGHYFEFQTQGFAIFALIPIWLYNGKKGKTSKALQYGFYAFYPVHLLVLYLIFHYAM